MQFKDYLKSCREASHLTQEKLTSELYNYDIDSFGGLDTTTISKWERGIAQPKASKQVGIIKYFQEQTGAALPCWENYTVEEAEGLICKEGVRNLIGKSKKLIYDFPSDMMSMDDIRIYPLRNSERIDALIDENMPLHQSLVHHYAQISQEKYREWALNPNSLFLACEYKGNFTGDL
jgi:transcriptional regulator with XRE-family HTH domain